MQIHSSFTKNSVFSLIQDGVDTKRRITRRRILQNNEITKRTTFLAYCYLRFHLKPKKYILSLVLYIDINESIIILLFA